MTYASQQRRYSIDMEAEESGAKWVGFGEAGAKIKRAFT